jgi:hypothetical protein
MKGSIRTFFVPLSSTQAWPSQERCIYAGGRARGMKIVIRIAYVRNRPSPGAGRKKREIAGVGTGRMLFSGYID